MYPVSNEYIKACRAPYKEERITGWIKLKDGTIVEINDSVIIQGTLKTTRDVFGNSFDIGTANCSKMTLKIRDDRAYDREFGGALIKLKYGLVTAVANDGTKTWEDIPITPYYVDGSKTTRKRNIISLTAYDTISRLQVDVPDEIPTTSLYMALQYACSRAGMGLAISEEEFKKLPNAEIIPDFSSESIQSCRDVVMWITQAVNCCAYTDYRGLLTLRQYRFTVDEIDRVINANERYSIEYSDTRTYLTYLQAYCGDDVKLYSKHITWTGGNTEHIKEGAFNLPKNPIIKNLSEKQQDTFNENYLKSDNRGGPTRTIKITGAIDPAIEPLDVLSFSGGDIDLGVIRSVATQIRWVYHGKGTLYCGNVSEATDVVEATSATSNENAEIAVMAAEVSEQAEETAIQHPSPKSQLEKRVDELRALVGQKYVSLPLTNPAAVTYDAIERDLLSVDFNVDGTDSAVVFAGAQQCTAASAGTVDISYKIDGATQDFKPSQVVAAGKNILPHYLAMALNKGKHNFAVYITSADGRGNTAVNGLSAALSGQISGIKLITPPNDNLLLYFGGIPAGTTITLPQMYSGSGVNKTVDWGDGSAAETSVCNAAVEHTYSDGGDYVVTIKSTETSFIGSSSGATWGDYLTAVYFPDNAQIISWTNILRNCPNLETVYFGKSATQISTNFTGNNGKLSSLIFPDTVTSISISGFSATSVSALTIPEKVTSLTDLSSNSNLRSIEFYNENLATSYGCRNATNLSSVYMTDKVTKIPGYEFLNCSALSEITLSQNITTIGSYAFGGTALTALPLLPKLTTIGNVAFQNCKSLVSAELGDKVTAIGNTAFKDCVLLTDVHIPSSVLTIGDSAFVGVPAAFTKSDFPSKLTSVGQLAFQNSGTVSTIIRSGATYGDSAFVQCNNLTDVTIEDGVATLPNSIFRECGALENIVIPQSVLTIDSSAFYKAGLTKATLNEGLVTIKSYAFAYSQLISVTIPQTLTTLGSYAFQNCKALESVAIQNGALKTISSNAFVGCSALKSVSLGSVTRIDSSAFSGCTSLAGISFNTDTVLGGSAFSGTGLKSLSILNYVKQFDDGSTSSYGGRYNIGSGCFYNCSALASVDGFEYKFDVGLKKTEYFRDDTSSSWGEAVVTDLGLRSDARGIYNEMGATEDNVFSHTALKSASNYLKEHPEYSDESTDTYRRTYTAYDIKPT